MIQTNWTEVKHLLLTDDSTGGSIAVIEVQPGEDVQDKVTLAIKEHFCIYGGTVSIPDTTLDLYRDGDVYITITDDDGDYYKVSVGITLIALYK